MELNIQEIERANKRVSAALNRRYEKNAELYISRQDVEEIKQWLYSGQFSFIFSKFKVADVNANILFLTILRNSWLIQSINPTQIKDYILPILKQVRPHYAKQYLKEVANRKIDVPELLRKELLAYYMQTLSYVEVEQLLASDEKLGVLRTRLLVARLLEQYVGSAQFFTMLEQFENDYPEIKGDIFFLTMVHVQEELHKQHMDLLAEWLNDKASRGQATQFYINALYFNTELLYDYALQQVKFHIMHKEKRKLWCKQIAVAANKRMRPKNADAQRKMLTNEIIQLYRFIQEQHPRESGYYIRYCLKRIQHSYFREHLTIFFTEQRIKHVDSIFQDDLQEALTGKKTGNITTIQQLLKEMEKSASDPRYINYLAFQFIDMYPKPNQWLELFDTLSYDSNRIRYFVTTVLKLSDKRPAVWLSYFEAVKKAQLQEQYAIKVIVQNAPNNEVAKRYLEQFDYQLYSETYRV